MLFACKALHRASPMYIKEMVCTIVPHTISALVAALCYTSLIPGDQSESQVSRQQLRFARITCLKSPIVRLCGLIQKLLEITSVPDCSRIA